MGNIHTVGPNEALIVSGESPLLPPGRHVAHDEAPQNSLRDSLSNDVTPPLITHCFNTQEAPPLVLNE